MQTELPGFSHSMVLVHLDDLWHCLCPSFQSGLLARQHLAKSAEFVLKVRPSIQWRSYAQCVQRLPNARSSPRQLDALKPPLGCHSFCSSQRRYNEQPHVQPGLSIQAIYEELRHASRKANYKHVQRLVKLLVNKLGEKPNQRLYHALILANANPEYGTPREVGSLLLEMVNLDISPDAATYHAALKVSNGTEETRAWWNRS